MKNIEKTKKYLISSIVVILMLFTFLSVIFTVEGNKNNKYIINSNGNVQIKEIWINGSKQKNDNFANAYNLTYNNDNDTINLNKDLEIVLPSIYEFNIIFERNETSGSIEAYNNNNLVINSDLSEEIGDYCIVLNDFSKKTIVKRYFNNDFKLVHILIIIVSGIIYYLTIKGLRKFLNSLKNNEIKISTCLIYFISCLFIIINTIYTILEIGNILGIFIYLTVILVGLIYLKDYFKNKLHYLFIYLMIPIGIIFSLAMPIDHIPDENSHFYKSFILSHELLINDIDKDNDYCIDDYHYINKLLSEYNYDIFNYHYTLKPRAFYVNYLKPYNMKTFKANNCYKNVMLLPFIGYTFTTLIISFASILHIPILLMYLMGRITNLLFYLVIVYYSIKNIPKYKKSLLIVSTLPIAIQQAGAFNQDCVHNSLFILLFAKIIETINKKEKISIKEISIIIIISLLLGFCKLGYFPIIFLCLLIPKERFNNLKEMIIKKSLLILPMLISFAFLYFTRWHSPIDYSTNDTQNVYSLFYIFKDPIDFIRLYLSTIKNSTFYMLIQGMMDGFAWSTVYNPTIVSYLIAGAYTLLFFTGSKDEQNKKSYIITTLISSLFIIFLIMTSMLGGNQLGARKIDGLQPRYFIPPLLMILPLFNIKLIKFNYKNEEYIYGILILLIYLGVLTTIVHSFYV